MQPPTSKSYFHGGRRLSRHSFFAYTHATHQTITLLSLIFIAETACLVCYQLIDPRNTIPKELSSQPINSFDPLNCVSFECSPNSSDTADQTGKNWTPKEPFVYLKVRGGLGNQLFQFACSYAIAKKHKIPFLVNKPPTAKRNGSGIIIIRADSRLQHGKFALHAFGIPLPPGYDTIEVTNQIIQIGGYCQSEVFFRPYKDKILEYFEPKRTLLLMGRKVLEWNKTITAYNEGEGTSSVSVHVRRGDFTKMKKVVVNSSFYLEAIDEVARRLKALGQIPTFFIFSDEIAPVRTDFQRFLPPKMFKDLRWVSDSEEALLEDFYLMSQCRHHILSGSTLAWWGAYLNRYSEKIVIGPHLYEQNFPENSFDLFEYRHLLYPTEWFAREADFD